MRRACDNPFAMHRLLRERYRLTAAEWQSLIARLEQLGWRGEIIGPCGSGKTTMLEDLAARLEERGWRARLMRFNTDDHRLRPLPRIDRSEIILCDGAEQLNAFDWYCLRRASRRASGLVITAHDRGRLPLLHRCETSPELLWALATSLDGGRALSACAELHARHDGNLRAALRELYDRWADGDDRSGSA
jgi:hypothetical protein